MGNRFLTFNAVIRVNQIEVARDKNVGEDEREPTYSFGGNQIQGSY